MHGVIQRWWCIEMMGSTEIEDAFLKHRQHIACSHMHTLASFKPQQSWVSHCVVQQLQVVHSVGSCSNHLAWIKSSILPLWSLWFITNGCRCTRQHLHGAQVTQQMWPNEIWLHPLLLCVTLGASQSRKYMRVEAGWSLPSQTVAIPGLFLCFCRGCSWWSQHTLTNTPCTCDRIIQCICMIQCWQEGTSSAVLTIRWQRWIMARAESFLIVMFRSNSSKRNNSVVNLDIGMPKELQQWAAAKKEMLVYIAIISAEGKSISKWNWNGNNVV